MLKCLAKWCAVALLILAVGVAAVVVCVRAAPVSAHELEQAWYDTKHPWSDQLAAEFLADHRRQVIRAEADHFVMPIGPSRAVRLMDAWSDPSGDIFLRFVARHFSSSADLHLLIVYCWSSEQHRLLWKAIEDHSP